MSKFNIGDKFEIEIVDVTKNDSWPYVLKGMPGIYSESYLKQFQKVNMTADEAWKIAGMVISGFTDRELAQIFGEGWSYPELMGMSPCEIKAKIEKWEAEKKFEVGDVVQYVDDSNLKVIIIRENGDETYNGITADGRTIAFNMSKGKWKKIDVKCNIKDILEQLKNM